MSNSPQFTAIGECSQICPFTNSKVLNANKPYRSSGAPKVCSPSYKWPGVKAMWRQYSLHKKNQQVLLMQRVCFLSSILVMLSIWAFDTTHFAHLYFCYCLLSVETHVNQRPVWQTSQGAAGVNIKWSELPVLGQKRVYHLVPRAFKDIHQQADLPICKLWDESIHAQIVLVFRAR